MGWITGNNLTQEQKENNADIIISYYRSQGLEDRAIAGILGNIDAESGFSPTLTEAGGGGGYGLVQWTPKSDLINACSTLGLSPYTSGDVQIQVILREILGNPASINQWYTTSAFISNYYNFGASSDMIGVTGQQFISNSMNWSPEKMAIMFMAGYERPLANQQTIHWEYRQQRARFWFEYMEGQVIEADYIARIAPFIRVKFYITSEWWEQPRNHRGLDISTGGNDNLYSMCDGTVVLKAWDENGYGNYMIMKDSTTGMGFLYGHMKEPTQLNVGDTVSKGQFVGIEGTTGHSTGNHLHLELQDLSNHDWIFHADKSVYSNPAEFMGIPNQEGISAVYYGGISPDPPGPTPPEKSTNHWKDFILSKRKKYY